MVLRRFYEARAWRCLAAATGAGAVRAAALAGAALVVAARVTARCALRAFVMKHFSSDSLTRSSMACAVVCITSEISEMISALARSSMRFSRNDRLFDLAR